MFLMVFISFLKTNKKSRNVVVNLLFHIQKNNKKKIKLNEKFFAIFHKIQPFFHKPRHKSAYWFDIPVFQLRMS